MFAHHHVQREPLSVRQRMTDVLSALQTNAFVDFGAPVYRRRGSSRCDGDVRAILELLREGLIEIVQSEAYAPLHVRLGNPARHLSLVADETPPTMTLREPK